jgi:hypothetical protein
MVEDSELDNFVNTELRDKIDQSDKVDDSVTDRIGEMGFLWDTVNKKLNEDSICFHTKRKIDLTKEKVRIVVAKNVEPGVVAFVSLSEDAYQEFLKIEEQKDVNKNE